MIWFSSPAQAYDDKHTAKLNENMYCICTKEYEGVQNPVHFFIIYDHNVQDREKGVWITDVGNWNSNTNWYWFLNRICRVITGKLQISFCSVRLIRNEHQKIKEMKRKIMKWTNWLILTDRLNIKKKMQLYYWISWYPELTG